MIKKLKKRFVLLSVGSIFLLLAVIVTGINTLNYRTVVRQADDTLAYLTENSGETFNPDGNSVPLDTPDSNAPQKPDRGFPKNRMPKPSGINGGIFNKLSPETPYESRFFTVTVDENGNKNAELSNIVSVDENTAAEYADIILSGNSRKGFIKSFRYCVKAENGSSVITFLDCGRRINAFLNFLITSTVVSVLGLVVMALILTFFAGKIIKPIAESYEKQKRFITDAGHEIKTPLTIINANADLLEMDIGENECLSDIKEQSKRLTELTNNLVYLSKMEENEDKIKMIDFPLSDIVNDISDGFEHLANVKEVSFIRSIQPMITLKGNESAVSQLVSILLDNAFKYVSEKGKVELNLKQDNTCITLEAKNDTDMIIKKENLSDIFDRFYRLDSSRNSETGGHGIGLSIAKAVVNAHGGKINASTSNGKDFIITVIFKKS
ncbi:MAG: HAMP domain-containing histidine kinase [Clostridia bacterium]|nr:HAMP domain-containing histidine kinase [Clostridia bacterium]